MVEPDLRCHAVDVISAAGVRIGWSDLPDSVHCAVARILGSSVREACSQAAGFSPGSADRVVTEAGRRAFVKAAGIGLNAMSMQLHRREAAVAAVLPTTAPAPALLGVHDDGDWVALVFDEVDGRAPRTPWVSNEIGAALGALDQLARTSPPPELLRLLPDAADELTEDLAGWQRIALDPPVDLDSWAQARLEQLCELASHAPESIRGDSLVHTDIRADNLLVRADGTVAVVDWPWASRGAAWFDRLSLLVNVGLYGGHDVERLVTETVPAAPNEITAVLVGLTGYFLDAARRAAPCGLPTVRAFQAAQGRSTLEWVKQRLA